MRSKLSLAFCNGCARRSRKRALVALVSGMCIIGLHNTSAETTEGGRGRGEAAGKKTHTKNPSSRLHFTIYDCLPRCTRNYNHTPRTKKPHTLTFVAAVAAQHRAAILLRALLPVRLARQAQAAAGARRTARWAGHALLSLLVRIVAIRAGVRAAAVQRVASAAARDALRLGRAVAGGARSVARGAAAQWREWLIIRLEALSDQQFRERTVNGVCVCVRAVALSLSSSSASS